MLCNIPRFLNYSVPAERQFLARGEVAHGVEDGGKLFVLCPALWDTLPLSLQLTKFVPASENQVYLNSCNERSRTKNEV